MLVLVFFYHVSFRVCCSCFFVRFSSFFFFKQKTAYEMRISDWSSDVCSSDLGEIGGADADALVGGELVGALELRMDDDRAAVVGGRNAQRVIGLDRHVDRGVAIGVGENLPAALAHLGRGGRSEERRVGKEGVRTSRSRWSPDH